MTVIHILLILGLVYTGFQQKKKSTRNLILVVTCLIAVYMMSKEGFVLEWVNDGSSGPYSMSGWPVSNDVSEAQDGSIKIVDGVTKFYFDFHGAARSETTGWNSIVVDESTPFANEVVRCKSADVQGVVGYNPATTNFSDEHLVNALGPKITDYLTCTVPETPFNVNDLLADLTDGALDDPSNLAQAQAQLQQQQQQQHAEKQGEMDATASSRGVSREKPSLKTVASS